ncbi:MAG TPA: choice-of-anchor L domain-containing protein, partial [Saprospiraceae bacterium]|nr:choice-of-anchor L domain-containing protein [Saprospiraceae bacterium]
MSVQLSGREMRAPLALSNGSNHIDLCGLTPGETYQVIAVAMAEGQRARFTVTLSDASRDRDALTISRIDRPESRRFVAQEECIDLQVNAMSTEAMAADIPMYLSVQCISCPNEWLDAFVEQAPMLAPNISTTGGVGATSLIQTTLIGGTCFDVTNVTSAGNSNSRGTFTNGAGSINIANGVILCTGNVNTVQGPNNVANASGGFNTNSAD